MLLDKRRVSLITKVVALLVALAFIMSVVVYVLPQDVPKGAFSGTQTGRKATPEERIAQFKSDVEAYRTAIKKYPNFENLMGLGSSEQNLAIAYAEGKKQPEAAPHWKAAAEAYLKALRAKPKDFTKSQELELRSQLAMAEMQSGQFKQAHADLQLVLKSDVKYATAYFFLGELFAMQNKLKEATQNWNKFLQLEPKGERADFAKQALASVAKAQAAPAGTSGQGASETAPSGEPGSSSPGGPAGSSPGGAGTGPGGPWVPRATGN